MKVRAGLVSLLLGLAWLPAALAAGEGAEPAKPPKTRVQDQLHRLIRAEAGFASPVAAEPAPEAVAGETVQLEPMLIEEPKLKEPQRVETKAEKFFRTGTIWQKVGPKFTREFWVGRSKGIGFTLSW